MTMDNNLLVLITPLVTLTVAITGGLWRSVNKKFETLNDVLTKHTAKEDQHNDKLADTLNNLSQALVKLQAEKGLLATTAEVNKLDKDLREEIVETRHTLRGEMQQIATKLEIKIEQIKGA
jgi:hypothetical protein